MPRLEDILTFLKDLPEEERKSSFDGIVHDLNNVITIITGFSDLLTIREVVATVEFKHWAKSVSSAGREFREQLEMLTHNFDVEVISSVLEDKYQEMLQPPPEEELKQEKPIVRLKRVLSAQQLFAQHAYLALFLGDKPEQFDFGAYIRLYERTYQHLFKKRNLSLVYGIQGEQLVTSELYATTLNNLLGNALKYSGSLGTEIRTLMIEGDDFVTVGVENDGDKVINSSDYERIFERGIRTEEDTSVHIGLSKGRGLYKAKSEVESYGGRIWVQSPIERTIEGQNFVITKEDGAGFYFTIPKELVLQCK